MNTPSETVQAAQRLLADRERVGLAKYGTTVDRTDLSPEQWLQYAIEEASDLLLYLIRLQTAKRQQIADAEAWLQRCADRSDAIQRERDDADRAAYLARWANAPDEATHLTEDDDGHCNWWRSEPEFAEKSAKWWPRVSDAHAPWFAGHHILGRVACEPRPGAEGER